MSDDAATTARTPSRRPRRPYRVGLFHWLARFIFGWGVLFGGFLVVALLAGDGGDTTGGDWLAGLVIVIPFMTVYLLFAWRMLASGVFVNDEGVVVRRLLRTRRFSWDEVVCVDEVRIVDSSLPRFVRSMYVAPPMARRATCVALRLTGDRECVVTDLNSSVPTWLGTKPAEIASRVQAARPE